MNETCPYENLTVLIVEDNGDARAILKSLAELDFKYVHTAKDGCEGIELFQKYKPDIILTDIQMPCMSGIDMVAEIRKSASQSLVIFLSAYSDVDMLLQAIDLKADAYLVKPFLYKELLSKISANLPSVCLESKPHTALSSREYEVFLDMARGIKPVDIASKYELKPKTVGTYRKRIFEKLHMTSNAELIKYALRYNLA
jgi:DNA-binding NarL/FixJ family response regulator